MQREMLALQ